MKFIIKPRLNFELTTLNKKLQDLINYHLDVLEFSYGDLLKGSELTIYSITKRILTLRLNVTEDIDPTDTFIPMNPTSDYTFLIQILIQNEDQG